MVSLPVPATLVVALGHSSGSSQRDTDAPLVGGVPYSSGNDGARKPVLGEPRSMQVEPRYSDVVAEVRDYLAGRAEAAMAAGVAREMITLDPGIGFGKTIEHNLALIAGLGTLGELGFPVLLGASRKRMIRNIDPSATEAGDRLGGSIALALEGARRGAAIVRVHDVRETVQALRLLAALSPD